MPRVYLIYRNRIFADAVGAVLRADPEIELVGTTAEPEQVAADVAALTPDVILLEGTDDGPIISDVNAILSRPTPCRLITLRLDEGVMHVWSQTWCQTVQPQDLLRAIMAAGTIAAAELQDRERAASTNRSSISGEIKP